MGKHNEQRNRAAQSHGGTDLAAMDSDDTSLADTIAKVFPESGKTADSIRELVTGKRVMVVKIPR